MKREGFDQILKRVKQGSDDSLVGKLSAHLQCGNQKICQLKPGGETISWRMSEEGVMEQCDLTFGTAILEFCVKITEEAEAEDAAATTETDANLTKSGKNNNRRKVS